MCENYVVDLMHDLLERVFPSQEDDWLLVCLLNKAVSPVNNLMIDCPRFTMVLQIRINPAQSQQLQTQLVHVDRKPHKLSA